MYRIWKGLDPKIVMSLMGSVLAIMVLVLHTWAFNQFGWPKTLKAKYNPPVAAVTR